MDYKYKGFTFRATDTPTKKDNIIVPLYEIDGLKDRATRPFLTTIRECMDFISMGVEEEQHQKEVKARENEDFPVIIAANIKAARSRAKLTQAASAGKCGCDIRQWKYWESGQRVPDWKNVAKIAKALSTSIHEIIKI